MDIVAALSIIACGLVSAVSLAVFAMLIGTNLFHFNYETAGKYGFFFGLSFSVATVFAMLAFYGHQAALHAAWWTLGITGIPLLGFALYLFLGRPRN
jgi:hypothetical protein